MMNKKELRAVVPRFFALFLLITALIVFVFLRFSKKEAITVVSQVDGYSLSLKNEKEFKSFLKNRNFFSEGVVLGDTSYQRTKISGINIVLTPVEQARFITNWERSGEIKVGIASDWQYIDGELTLFIYINDGWSGLQDENATLFFNAQVLKSIIHLTRQQTLYEDANAVTNTFTDPMLASNTYWIELESTP